MEEVKDPALTQKNEFRFVGMSRSGNHAIINWVIQQLDGHYLFLNCAEPKHNPYLTARPLSMDGPVYRTNMIEFKEKEEQEGKFIEKDYLLYSYEDCFLGTLNHPGFRKKREQWVGRSLEQKEILILRDPFNLFASRKKSNLLRGHYSHGAKPISTAVLKRIYKQHAREYLGARKNLRHLVPIKFNTWTRSRDYREEISRELGIPFTDKGFLEVSKVAGGSSFDGVTHSGAADKMNLNDRWKKYAEDEEYWELFDEELVEITQKIFGKIEPVRYYVEEILGRFSKEKI